MNANIRAIFVNIFHEMELYERDDEVMNRMKLEFESLFKEFKNIPEECEFKDTCGEEYCRVRGIRND